MSAAPIPAEVKTPAYLPGRPATLPSQQVPLGRGAPVQAGRGGGAMMMAGGRGGVQLRPGQQRPTPGGKQAGPQALTAQRQAAAPVAPEPSPMEEVGPDVIEKELTGPDAFVWSNYSTLITPGHKVNAQTFDIKLAGDEIIGVWMRGVRLNFGIQENKFQKGTYQVTLSLSYKWSRPVLEFVKTGREFFIQQIKSQIEVINDLLQLEGTMRWKADEIKDVDDGRGIFVKPYYKFQKEAPKDEYLYDYDWETENKELQAARQQGGDVQQGVAFDHGDGSAGFGAAPPADGSGIAPMDAAGAGAGAGAGDGVAAGTDVIASFGVQDTTMAGAVDQAIHRCEQYTRFDQKGNFIEPYRNMVIDLVRDLKKFRFDVLKPGTNIYEPKRIPGDFYLSQKRPCDIFFIIQGAYLDMSTKKVTLKGYTNWVQVGEGKDAQVSARSVKGRTAPPAEDTVDSSGRVADPRNAKRQRTT